MNPDLPSLVFLGTPDFAVPSLRRLVESGADVRLVVTQPDKPVGRGRKLAQTPVKVAAEGLGIPVYQPPRIKTAEALERVSTCGAECAAVVAYGQILSQAFLDIFPLGVLNVHASLLPKYRGAAPINRCIMEGDRVTGVSIMLLDAGMDTGPVLTLRETPIGEAEPFGAVHDRMALMGADLFLDTLVRWKAGLLVPEPQDNALATLAPPIRKEELRISWELPAGRIVDRIRAFDPWPGAFAMYEGRRLKLFSASLAGLGGEGVPGEVLGCSNAGMIVRGGDGPALAVGEIQAEGRRRMPASEFLRGGSLPPGSRLE